ncbi:50S ribosome-binding GTPase [Allochromatium humboldtianum]|uniref:50S ribosome-binding GTPase n=1 Tax=Allochromatium humboldtianum TaxID=504901 RepID=A0A850RDI1_9GAMM|nr:GTPase [Allochromatium humboldtianum]NVZ11408.1 50S ribosome-binding GTPase [Allochromatium humboldtianum]
MNIGISESIDVTFDRYLPKTRSLRETLASALQIREQALKVTNCGLLKAGKSSLFNALTDHLETELFKTSPVRATIKNQTENETLSNHPFVFTDTPGLDAKNDKGVLDDVEAWKEVLLADVLLFVHNPSTGELHQAEIEFLTQLASEVGVSHQGLSDRLLVILSHLDSCAGEMEKIASIVRNQVKDCVGFEPRIFPVSFTTYRKGRLEQKPKLIEHSRIPTLRNYLVEQLERLQEVAQNARQRRIIELKNDLLLALDQQINEREKQISQLKRRADAANASLKKDFEQFLKQTRHKISVYDAQGY